MKVAFFVSTFPVRSETFVVSQITGLLDRGHDVRIHAEFLAGDRARHRDTRRYDLLARTVCRRSVQGAAWWRRLPDRLRLAVRTLLTRPGLALRAMNPAAFGKRALTLDVLDLAAAAGPGLEYDVVHAHFASNAEDAAILQRLGLLRGRTDADVFLLPSVAEALPVSVMEAMACALPVVATAVGSLDELVQDERTGRLVPPADPAALAAALVELLDARDTWPALGRAGRARVTADYDVRTLNDRLVEHYRALVAAS